MNATKQISQFLVLFRPIAPWHWTAISRRLAAADGWMPPMMLIAALGSGFAMHGLCEMLLGPRLGFAPQILTWATWFLIGLIATFTVARRGATHLVRYGLWGFTRPRWWFEAARLAWLVTLLDAILLVMALSLDGLPRPVEELGKLAFVILPTAAFAWVVTASTGYLLAWVRWLPLRGKAFDCVHYFYTLTLSTSLAAIGVNLWECNAPWLECALGVALGTAGAILFFAAFVGIVSRWERGERRAAASQ